MISSTKNLQWFYFRQKAFDVLFCGLKIVGTVQFVFVPLFGFQCEVLGKKQCFCSSNRKSMYVGTKYLANIFFTLFLHMCNYLL